MIPILLAIVTLGVAILYIYVDYKTHVPLLDKWCPHWSLEHAIGVGIIALLVLVAQIMAILVFAQNSYSVQIAYENLSRVTQYYQSASPEALTARDKLQLVMNIQNLNRQLVRLQGWNKNWYAGSLISDEVDDLQPLEFPR